MRVKAQRGKIKKKKKETLVYVSEATWVGATRQQHREEITVAEEAQTLELSMTLT